MRGGNKEVVIRNLKEDTGAKEANAVVLLGKKRESATNKVHIGGRLKSVQERLQDFLPGRAA
jgi:hypothetical protein